MQPQIPRPRPSIRFPLPALQLLALASLAAACAAPAPRPIDADRLAAEVASRGATPEEVASALELAGVSALPLERPEVGPSPDYDQSAFWHASALAFHGETRAARRRVAEARALARAAGAPRPAELEVEHVAAFTSDRSTLVTLTFDLLGLLDSGRSAAARELAREEVRAALGDLEGRAWTALFEVDRARTEIGDALGKQGVLRDLLTSARASLRRAELLESRGRLSGAESARLRTMVYEVQHALHLQEWHLALHRRALADAAGIAPSSPPLAALTARTLEVLFEEAQPAHVPLARELFDRSPSVRRARLEYAVAEARLREAVAWTRPGLHLGPNLQLDDALPGGTLALELPHAGALSGRVEAALQARERTREALEETLRAALARIADAQARYTDGLRALKDHAEPREADTNRVWRAARARFETDAEALEGLAMALRDRSMALQELFDVRHEVVLAWLDLRAACGPEARPQERPLAAAESTPAEQEVRP